MLSKKNDHARLRTKEQNLYKSLSNKLGKFKEVNINGSNRAKYCK